MAVFSFNVLNVNSLECVSMNNQECKIGSETNNVNANDPIFYPYGIKINKFKGSCNKINNSFSKILFLTTLKTQMSKYLI